MAGFILAQRAKNAQQSDKADEAAQVVSEKFLAGKNVLGDGLDGMLVKNAGGTETVKIGEGASGGVTSINEDGEVQEMEDGESNLIVGEVSQQPVIIDSGYLDDSVQLESVKTGVDFTVPPGRKFLTGVYLIGGGAISFTTSDYVDQIEFQVGSYFEEPDGTSHRTLSSGTYTDYDVYINHWFAVEHAGDKEKINLEVFWQILSIPA